MSDADTREAHLARYRKNFADYTMVELGAWPVRLYQLRKPGHGGMEGVDVLVMGGDVDERIVITGDLAPNDNQGCVSNIGYGVDWFAGRKSDDYLCGKFLRQVWVPEDARAAIKDRLAEEQRDAADEDLDADERETARERAEKLAEAVEYAEEFNDPARSSEAFHELWEEVYDDTPEDLGFGYDPRSAALLVAIQETFARLYWAKREAETLTATLGPLQQPTRCDTAEDVAALLADPPPVAQGAA